MPTLTETEERDWQRPDHGEIVCHCELVTRREIETALNSACRPETSAAASTDTGRDGPVPGLLLQRAGWPDDKGRLATPLALDRQG